MNTKIGLSLAAVMILSQQVSFADEGTVITLAEIRVEAKKSGPLGSENVLSSVNIIDGGYLENQNVT